MKFQIKNRFSGDVQFECEIDAKEMDDISLKLRLAVLIAFKTGANLSDADLSGADLSGANLRGADLRGADLRDANLRDANLLRADLSDANLLRADLSGAILRDANLLRADLSDANLRDAILRDANLLRADLSGVKNLKSQPSQTVIVSHGDLIVYKKLNEGVATLLIPKEAKRSNATGRKCRAEYAVVLELPDGVETGTSKHDSNFVYKVGETVRPHEWCNDWSRECAGGIHFFITKEEADAY